MQQRRETWGSHFNSRLHGRRRFPDCSLKYSYDISTHAFTEGDFLDGSDLDLAEISTHAFTEGDVANAEKEAS